MKLFHFIGIRITERLGRQPRPPQKSWAGASAQSHWEVESRVELIDSETKKDEGREEQKKKSWKGDLCKHVNISVKHRRKED